MASTELESSQLDQCGSMADRRLKALVQTVEFPVEFIQWGHVEKIERVGFEQTTPGSIDQNYVATYKLTYKPSVYALFQEQIVEVQFASPMICDDLKLRCLGVVSSKLTGRVDESLILKKGPLSCQP